MAERKIALGLYVLQALHRRGIKQIFGIPGDFALNFFQAIEKYKKLKLLTFSHEPGLGFAADGASRITRQPAAVAVTFGAGALNIVNAVACAYAEKSPLIVISGAPGLHERSPGILFHHQAKNLQSQKKIFQEITVYQTVLEDPLTAVEEIEKTLTLAEELASPVYLEIPRDLVWMKVPVPRKLPALALPEDEQGGREAAREIAQKIKAANRPVLMIGVEVHRFDLIRKVVKLAEKMQAPVVSSFMARGTFPVDHPLFAGTYLGPAGDPKVMSLVENSDALLLLGVLLADTNMAVRLNRLNPAHLMHAISRQVTVGHHHYDEVSLEKLIEHLLGEIPKSKPHCIAKSHPFPKLKGPGFFDNSSLTVEAIIQAINHLFHRRGSMPVVADNGDCLFASLDIHTPNLLASGYYATMGFAVPAGMGVQLGSGKRAMILVGDGAFQMTGPEISHCPRFGLNPIVIVFNNRSWEMLRSIQPQGNYFGLTPWDFAALAELWGGVGYRVSTKREMHSSLEAAYRQKKFTLIDAILPLGETSSVLKKYLQRIRG